jgi:serine/threonine-protein kinase
MMKRMVMLKAGDRIGEWLVERALGEGGMGAVYRVHSALSQRVVAALKVMKPTNEPDARARFVREAEALSALRHPAIVHVMGFSEDSVRGVPYIVMELAVGQTLKERLEKGPLPVAEVITTFAVLAGALDHAHASGVFHRDIKPANVILVPDGTVRLVDFGIAVAAANDNLNTSGHLGTLSYLPPEVFRGEPADPPKMDVYAFGLLLHEALTGQRAFPVEPGLTPPAAAAAVGVRKLHQSALDTGAGVPDRLRDIVRRSTDPIPSARPTMHEVRTTLDALRDRRAVAPAGTVPPAWAETVMRPSAEDENERTTRVPDPTGRITVTTPPRRSAAAAAQGRRLPLARAIPWVALALLVAGGVVAALASRGGRSSPQAQAAGRDDERVPLDPPRGTAPLPAASRPPFPSPRPTPSLSPLPSPSVAPSARPSPPPSAPPSPIPSPSLRPSPGPSPFVSPATAHASPPPRAAPTVPDPGPPAAEPIQEGPAEVPDVGGRWELTNEVESTNHPAFEGLKVGYRLRLRQDGARITGTGEKVSENGVLILPSQRTPITVTGTVEGSQVVLRFTEQGAERPSGGVFRWRLSPDGSSLEGRFSSDAAASQGTSVASRVN